MDDDRAAVVIGLILLAFPIAIALLCLYVLYKLAQHLYEHPEALARLLLFVTAPIWVPPMLAAWVVIVLGRNCIVYLWHLFTDANAGFFLVVWATVVPVLLTIAWLEAGYYVSLFAPALKQLPILATLFRIYPGWPDAFFAYTVVSAPLVVSMYFRLYRRPPKHANWAFFIAAEEQMKFDTRLTLLRLKTGLRLIAGR